MKADDSKAVTEERDAGPWYVWTCYKMPVSRQFYKRTGTLPIFPYRIFGTFKDAQDWLDNIKKR